MWYLIFFFIHSKWIHEKDPTKSSTTTTGEIYYKRPHFIQIKSFVLRSSSMRLSSLCRNPLSIQCKFCLVLFNGVNSKAIHHNKNPSLTTVFFIHNTSRDDDHIYFFFVNKLILFSCFKSGLLYPCSVNRLFFLLTR